MIASFCKTKATAAPKRRALSLTCVDEGIEEFVAVDIHFKQILRMPLDSPDEAFSGHPGGFDEAVGSNGHDFQARCQVFDSLMMERIDGDFGLAEEFL